MDSTCPAVRTGSSSTVFLTLINALMATKCSLNTTKDYHENYAPHLNNEDIFDFIVVGAGSAGAVVANRLSENRNVKVLLLEAGGYPSENTEVPATFLALSQTAEDWDYFVEPESGSSLGLKGKRARWPRGKTLGGSSSINAMLYIKGNARDYDTWEAEGNPNWGWQSVQKYFKKSFNDGYLKTTDYQSTSKMRKVILDSAEELGQSVNQDTVLGYHESPVTIDNGRRCSSAKAFLSKIKNRPNLHIAMNAQVLNLLFKSNDEVNGVKVRINNVDLTLQVRREVILSAGAIGSPQILMLSGIGPKKHLQNVNIKVHKDLNVGGNLQDHLTTFSVFLKFNQTVEPTAYPVDEMYEYCAHHSGPLSTIDVTNIVAFLNTKSDGKIYPNVQVHHLLLRKNEAGVKTMLDVFGYNDASVTSIMQANKESDLLLISGCILNPKSRGLIHLNANNPYGHPLLYSGYLTDANGDDMQTLLDYIHYVQNLLETQTMEKLGAEILEYNIPNCDKLNFNTDEYWKCHFTNMATTIFHQASTCRMGPSSDVDAVVDSRLRVHGVKGVRVIDASIMPNIVSGNTNGPTIMIGEKGADLIKEDNQI